MRSQSAVDLMLLQQRHRHVRDTLMQMTAEGAAEHADGGHHALVNVLLHDVSALRQTLRQHHRQRLQTPDSCLYRSVNQLEMGYLRH